MSRHRFIQIFILTIVLVLIILFLLRTSEDPRWGAGIWRSWLEQHLGMNPVSADFTVKALRKSLHFLGYAFLGILFAIYFRLWGSKKYQVIGTIAALMVAGLDEWLQTQSSFRSGQSTDVLLDLSGIVAGQLLLKLRFRKQRPPTQRRKGTLG